MSLHGFGLTRSGHFLERLWDIACICSIVGIWPRYLEPQLLLTSHHTIPCSRLPREFEGLRIAHISDLHYCSSYTSPEFLHRVHKRLKALDPHLIVFTGDLLCYAELDGLAILQAWLSSIKAPLGCYAVLGNHDYSEYVSLGGDGQCHIVREHTPMLSRICNRLLGRGCDEPIVHHAIPEHPEVRVLFDQSGWTLLSNATVQVGMGRQRLNITGLGDLMAGQCNPSMAFANTDMNTASVVLAHNPDSYPLMERYPGDLFLFGHTHGGQVNLPFICQKVMQLQHREFKSGLVWRDDRALYINRGLGSGFPFRLFAPPEIALHTLVHSGAQQELAEQLAHGTL